MAAPSGERKHSGYVDTPTGLFTAAGAWFRTTEAALRDYAGEVLERVPLERLLGAAEVWLRSAETIALWSAPLLLAVLPPLPATLAALTVYAAWSVVGPSFTSLAVLSVLRVLDKVWAQGLYYVVSMTLLAWDGPNLAMWAGLGLFVALRWGLASRVLGPVIRPMQARLYTLPVADQILRGFLIRYAMKYRLSLPQLDRIERQIVSGMRRPG